MPDVIYPAERDAIARHLAEKGVTRVPMGGTTAARYVWDEGKKQIVTIGDSLAWRKDAATKARIMASQRKGRLNRMQIIRDMAAQGVVAHKIAKRLGISADMLRSLAEQHGIEVASTINEYPVVRTEMTEELRQQIAERIKAGRTVTQTAADLNVSRSAVARHAQRMGLRPVKGAPRAAPKAAIYTPRDQVADRRRQIAAHAAQGLTAPQIAEAMRMGVSLVYADIKAAGIVLARSLKARAG
jgi:transposase